MFWKEKGLKLENFYYDDKEFIVASYNEFTIQYKEQSYKPLLAYIFKYLEKLYESGNLVFKGNMGTVQWRNTTQLQKTVYLCGLAKEEHVDFIDIILFKAVFVFWDIVRSEERNKRQTLSEIRLDDCKQNFRKNSGVVCRGMRHVVDRRLG